MREWGTGTAVGDLKGLSQGSIPPFPTKNQTDAGAPVHLLRVGRMDGMQRLLWRGLAGGVSFFCLLLLCFVSGFRDLGFLVVGA